MAKVDLHIHTTASDGEYSVSEILSMSKAANLTAIAITDHDTIASSREALDSNIPDLEIITGIEISTYYGKNRDSVHILGYLFDINNTTIKEIIKLIKESRIPTSIKILDKFDSLGIVADKKDVDLLLEKESIGVLDISNTILKNPKNRTNPHLQRFYSQYNPNPVYDFYKHFLTSEGCAYAPYENIISTQAIEMLKQTKAIPVIAHPGALIDRSILDDLISAGLLGIEVYTTNHSPETAQHFLKIAEQKNLLITAGSDYHGPNVKDYVSFAQVPEDNLYILENMKQLHHDFFK